MVVADDTTKPSAGSVVVVVHRNKFMRQDSRIYVKRVPPTERESNIFSLDVSQQ